MSLHAVRVSHGQLTVCVHSCSAVTRPSCNVCAMSAVKYQPTPLNITGDITILLMRSDQMSIHDIKQLSTPLKLDLFNFHILQQRQGMHDLMRAKSLKLKTMHGKHKMKTTRYERSLLLQPAKKTDHGTCNDSCCITRSGSL